MPNSDDFLESTKRTLRDRAGNRCSFPGCNSPTSGPSNESLASVDSTGMACHIFAAAPGKGAKRYNSSMFSEQRRAADNGIWMCYKHGKQIDNDECRFTSDLLLKWKEVAERRAQIENELGRHIENGSSYFKSIGLAANNINIQSANGNENEIIGDALLNSCVSTIWGDRLVGYIRGYLIERARNAFVHGKASSITLKIESERIVLIDDGDDFSHHDLLSSDKKGGGAESKNILLERFGDRVISVSQRIDGNNINTISLLHRDSVVGSITPCVVDLSNYKDEDPVYNAEIIETCSDVYILLPKYFTLSDLYWIGRVLNKSGFEESRIVVVTNYVADYIPEALLRQFPDIRVIDLSKLE